MFLRVCVYMQEIRAPYASLRLAWACVCLHGYILRIGECAYICIRTHTPLHACTHLTNSYLCVY